MQSSRNQLGAITLFTEDLEQSKTWYEQIFHVAPVFADTESAAYQFEDLIINLLKAEAAYDLIAPTAVARPHEGARYQLTIPVDDVDAVCAELAELGIGLMNGPVNRPWGQRTVAIVDPSGHIWEFATDIPTPQQS